MYDADHPARAIDALAETVARIDDLTARPLVSPAIASRIALDAAHAAYQAGRAAAVAELMTTEQAARSIGRAPRTVQQLARAHGIGWQISRNTWLFRPEDVEQLRDRPVGRPKRSRA